MSGLPFSRSLPKTTRLVVLSVALLMAPPAWPGPPPEVGDLLVSGFDYSPSTGVGAGHLYRYRSGEFTLLADGMTGGGGILAVGLDGAIYSYGLFGTGLYRYDLVTEAATFVFDDFPIEAMTVGPDGRVYVVRGLEISAIDPTSGAVELVLTVPAAPLGVGGIAFDQAGNLYIAGEAISDGVNSGQVLKWSGSGAAR